MPLTFSKGKTPPMNDTPPPIPQSPPPIPSATRDKSSTLKMATGLCFLVISTIGMIMATDAAIDRSLGVAGYISLEIIMALLLWQGLRLLKMTTKPVRVSILLASGTLTTAAIVLIMNKYYERGALYLIIASTAITGLLYPYFITTPEQNFPHTGRHRRPKKKTTAPATQSKPTIPAKSRKPTNLTPSVPRRNTAAPAPWEPAWRNNYPTASEANDAATSKTSASGPDTPKDRT